MSVEEVETKTFITWFFLMTLLRRMERRRGEQPAWCLCWRVSTLHLLIIRNSKNCTFFSKSFHKQHVNKPIWITNLSCTNEWWKRLMAYYQLMVYSLSTMWLRFRGFSDIQIDRLSCNCKLLSWLKNTWNVSMF